MAHIRPVGESDRALVGEFLDAQLGSRQQAAHGELMDCHLHRGFAAFEGEQLIGVAMYRESGGDYEMTALACSPRLGGVGSRLVEAVVAVAREAGAGRLWLITTNDNIDAARFYQRRGFRLRRVSPGAVDESRRTLKPVIPVLGNYGIPMHDELEFELRLQGT